MTTHLKDKIAIRGSSYKPENVRAMEEAGDEIIDIVTSGRGSPALQSWAWHFLIRGVPCFAARMAGDGGQVKLWIRRTVGHDGELL